MEYRLAPINMASILLEFIGIRNCDSKIFVILYWQSMYNEGRPEILRRPRKEE